MSKAPAIQIKEQIVAHLQTFAGSASDSGFSIDVSSDQIRGILDLSGAPKGLFGITVSAEDQGDWAGNTGRILVSIKPSITVFTHLDEDLDGAVCDSLVSDVLTIMQSMVYNLEGWNVAWNGNWQITDTAMDNSFRQVVLSAVLPITRKSQT